MALKLLHLMSDGQFHSGEALGAALGVSRTAIWKQLAAWRQRGLSFDVVPGKGYRLTEPFEAWSSESLSSFMGASARSSLSYLRIVDQTSSTNDDVMRLMRETRTSGIVCLAEEQTAGRGRRGREWFSPVGANFYGSLGWIFPEGIAAVEGLSLAVGVAIARALRRYGADGISLKWPNDIMVGEAKLGGVLVELQAESDGPCMIVVGVGLNLRVTNGMADQLGRPVAGLAHCAQGAVQRNQVGGLLLDELLLMLSSYGQTGFAGYRDDWLELDGLRDCPVAVTGLEREITGIARGVDHHGALRVETISGTELIHGGEVSLRRSEG